MLKTPIFNNSQVDINTWRRDNAGRMTALEQWPRSTATVTVHPPAGPGPLRSYYTAATSTRSLKLCHQSWPSAHINLIVIISQFVN